MKYSLLSSIAATALIATSALGEEVRVYNWSDYIDEDLLQKFEKETGIDLIYDVFDSNEVLETKMLAGGSGYDVVVPTGTFLERQITAGVFQKLDKDKLPNISNMWDVIEDRVSKYDPGNEYAVNYMWGTTGLGVNMTKVKEVLGEDAPVDSLDLVFKPENMEKLAECALRHGLLIISDEIYEQIVFDGFHHTSIASISKEVQKQCVVINGVSKSYAMTGWRIGYIAAGDPEIVKQVSKLQGQSTSNPCATSQAASIEALAGSLDEVRAMVREFEKRRNIIVERLTQIPGVSCRKPTGSFYSFPDFSGVYGKKDMNGKVLKGSLDFSDYLLSAEKVAIVPGIAFGADAHARLAFAMSLEKIEAGTHRIKEAIENLQ